MEIGALQNFGILHTQFLFGTLLTFGLPEVRHTILLSNKWPYEIMKFYNTNSCSNFRAIFMNISSRGNRGLMKFHNFTTPVPFLESSYFWSTAGQGHNSYVELVALQKCKIYNPSSFFGTLLTFWSTAGQ